MADEEATNEQQPDAGADEQPENAGETTPESEAASPEPDDSGADVAPEAESGADAEASAPNAAEQLANDALAAARNAVADLDDDSAPGQETDQEPAAAAAAAPAPGGDGSLTGSMMGSGAAPQPTPFTPEQLMHLASVEGGEGIDILSDVDLNVKIELGKTRMLVEDVLKLSNGAVVELDKLAGDPVDIYVNERHVARGEVLILNDNFCVRVSEVLEATIEER